MVGKWRAPEGVFVVEVEHAVEAAVVLDLAVAAEVHAGEVELEVVVVVADREIFWVEGQSTGHRPLKIRSGDVAGLEGPLAALGEVDDFEVEAAGFEEKGVYPLEQVALQEAVTPYIGTDHNHRRPLPGHE